MKSLFNIAAVFAFLVASTGGAQDLAVDYRYQAGSKTDPFLPMAFELPQAGEAGLTALQRYDVKEYFLVGTLVGSEISALILTPDKKEGVIARVGERMGKRGGRIISIGREKMVVREPKSRGLRADGPKHEDLTLELTEPEADASVANATRIGTEVPSALEQLSNLRPAGASDTQAALNAELGRMLQTTGIVGTPNPSATMVPGMPTVPTRPAGADPLVTLPPPEGVIR